MVQRNDVLIIGGGLAGCEAAWQLANRGVEVKIAEMRPTKMTPVHKGNGLAELVCSNSLGSKDPNHANGILKSELSIFDSLIMRAAKHASVPAGQALAVDRDIFSSFIEKELSNHALISIERKDYSEIPKDRPLIIATGPMTSPELAENLKNITGDEYFYFYDAVSPVVSLESIDMEHCFRASRYDKGDAEYLNCPMTQEEYDLFLDALLSAEKIEDKDYEQRFFESCLPVEEIARRGRETLRFGPMKPVGLPIPTTGKLSHAVVQLRQENKDGTCYNLVGFQTRLKWNEQKRVFKLIPALKNAEFLRLGVMHRNIFLNAPRFMKKTGLFSPLKDVFIAGQLSGVEGYVESTASGLICGINCARLLKNEDLIDFPQEMALGALMNYIVSADEKNFQPMNINMGLFPPLDKKYKKKSERNERIAQRAGEALCELRQIKQI